MATRLRDAVSGLRRAALRPWCARKCCRGAVLVVLLSTGLVVPAISAASGPTLVVPFAAGGPSDQLARRIAQDIGRTTGDAAPAVLNVPGALAAYERFRAFSSGPDAAANGPVLLMADLDTALVLREAAGVDITAALAPIALLGHRPLAIYAAAGSADAQSAGLCAADGCMLIATPSLASQRCAANLARQLGLPPSQVLSYRATGAAVADLGMVPGSLLCMTAQSPTLAGAQGLRLLAWGSPTTLAGPAGPAPMLTDLGLQPLSPAFVGLFAGLDLAVDATDRLATAVHSVLADPGFRSWAVDQGLLEPAPSLLITTD